MGNPPFHQFLSARAPQATGNEADINHFIGLGRLYRAKEYYGKVQSYSDVPWYSKDLQTTDTEELYKTQDPRALVVDSIMADLDFAVKNMRTVTARQKSIKSWHWQNRHVLP